MVNTTISFPSLAYRLANPLPNLLPITLMTPLRSAITVFGRPIESRPIFTALSSEHFRRIEKKPMTRIDRCIHYPAAEKNYGVAITGIIDRDGKTLPVRLTTDVNEEKPVMDENSNSRPDSANLNLNVTVSGLKPGVAYNLYRYNSFDNVPESGFNAKASKANKHWEINIKEGASYVLKETIRSDQVAVYRAVPGTAP
ncbi:hypothetical protein ALP73_01183 [Pseudomonas coronafaciens pv. garcae]|uniref:Lipoprotein n=1 Tax=Pseudomonas coronafaciens pv. garcae TaxID=251653 RepID=A0AB37QLC8_9PSED|nr:hypothetical protein ALQ71_200022 [Pseudomonas coronafaciens pv. striafaciens]RMR97877.1 hypothetical protein ALP74_00374 [Pseudomonas coronafaciens pv. garcae]RMS98135.1 hypothetical protein ALP55_01027 [Pseudomonas coronafaciens pv. oryzae]RMV07248.1 hypothetical protein ALP20_00037 [Pseudomonas coronafaciens pv. coronafaciens]RMS05475.1 hypothetical protein ALP73_01183 [Pseudomonas coronafaciens pv. garcae]